MKSSSNNEDKSSCFSLDFKFTFNLYVIAASASFSTCLSPSEKYFLTSVSNQYGGYTTISYWPRCISIVKIMFSLFHII